MSNNTNYVYFANEIEARLYSKILSQCAENVVKAFIPVSQFLEFALGLELLEGEGEADFDNLIPACLENEAFHDILSHTFAHFLALYGAENIVPMTGVE